MKKYIKIILIILGILLLIVIIDTAQAKIFNNSPLIKIKENIDGGVIDYIDNGILVKHYSFINNEKKTVFKWEKYAPPVTLKSKEELKGEEQEEKIQKYSKTIDETIIKLDIPNKWKYEEIMPTENNGNKDDFSLNNYKFGLKIYKDSSKGNVTLYVCSSPIGVCGTDLKSEKIELNNGKYASAGYYNNSKIWSFISLYENTYIYFLNYGLEEDEANEVLDFVKTINIDKYTKIKNANLKAEGVDTETLVRFNGILYGESYKMIEYCGETEPVGKITKLIDNKYVPKYNNETNTKEILNALVYSPTDTGIFINYQNGFRLFEKIEEK